MNIPFYEIYYANIKNPSLIDLITYKLHKHNKNNRFNKLIYYLDNIKFGSTDKEKFIGTKNNIEQFSQLEPGVVLTDGRVIDGNRRFTCLRVLHRETGKQEYNYFEAVILVVYLLKIVIPTWHTD